MRAPRATHRQTKCTRSVVGGLVVKAGDLARGEAKGGMDPPRHLDDLEHTQNTLAGSAKV